MRTAVLGAALLLVTIPAAAQSTATITGRVTNAATGQPVAGVFVFGSAPSTANATTGADGTYATTVPAPGVYTLQTSNTQQLVNQTYGGDTCPAAGCGAGRSFSVSPGQTFQADFALEPGIQLTGRIYDAVTAQPLAFRVLIFDTQRQVVRSVMAAADGRYSTETPFDPGLPAGTYFAAVFLIRLGGHVNQIYPGINCASDCRMQDAAPIRVAPRQTISGIDFALQPFAAVTGRVVDSATGQPISGVGVRISERTSLARFDDTTDAAGVFVIEGVPPGTYSAYTYLNLAGYVPEIFANASGLYCMVLASFDDCRPNLRAGTPVIVSGPGTVSGIDFALDPGGSISGVITQGGQPLPHTNGGSMTLHDSAGRQIALGLADGTGAYRILGLPPGTYFAMGGVRFSLNQEYAFGAPGCHNVVCVTSGTPIVVGSAAVTGIDFALPSSTATVSGTLLSDTGTPLANANVFLIGSDGSSTFKFTASDGSYAFSTVPPGTYRVRAEAAGYIAEWYDNACVLCGERGTAVIVTTGQTVPNVNFTLNPAGQIKGQLSVAGGTLVESLVVEALRADGSVVASVGSANQYTIEGLPSGSYYVRVRSVPFSVKGFSFGGHYPPVLYNNIPCESVDCPLTSATPVAVTAGSIVTGIDFTVTTGATISGRVIAEGFSFLPGDTVIRSATSGARVEAFTADGRPAGNRFSTILTTDTYSIVGLRPGTYYLRASVPGFATQLYKDVICPACPPQRGHPVTVTAGGRTGVDFLMLPGGSIAGLVRDGASGDGISGMTVNAYSRGGTLMGTTTTDQLGGYIVENLGAGEYFVATSNRIGYADEVYEDVACGTCDPARGRPVAVQGGAVTSGITIALARGALLTGRVTDTQATDAAATVSLFDSSGAPVARVSTAAGSYLASVPAGTTFARAQGTAGLGVMRYDNVPCADATCDPTGGTPIAVSVGARVQNVDFALPVCGPTLLTPAFLPNGAVGASYSTTIAASGAGPYSFSVTSGSLPPGLTLAANGTLSGTPSAPGRYTIGVAATNAAGCGDTRTYIIDITACTPTLGASLGEARFDVAGAGATVTETAAGTCQPAIAINVPWIAQGRVFPAEPSSYEFIVAPNPGGRRTGTITFGNRSVVVNQAGHQPMVPFGSFDTPADGTVVSGSIAVSGWVLDDLRVLRVDLYRSPAGGEGTAPVFLGTAVLVPGARPDVEAIYADLPFANRAGWGYLLLTNMLPNQGNGTFTLYAFAEDAEGHRVGLGTRTIVPNNAAAIRPFGAIDTPAQGETIGGTAYVNYGWALTPLPKTIPTDGSTIRVLIDGVDVGQVSYNHFRSDVAGLFPGLNNSSGPVGFRTLDTTALDDGLHTIAWIVTDNAGSAEGIGSRYFTVANNPSLPLAASRTQPSARAATPLPARELRVRSLDRVTIDLSPYAGPCRASYAGSETVRDERRPLPIGSTLDSETGLFAWTPGPAFIGRYQLAFTVSDCAGSRQLDVVVIIQ